MSATPHPHLQPAKAAAQRSSRCLLLQGHGAAEQAETDTEEAAAATDDARSVDADDEALSSSDTESDSDSDSDGGLPTSIAKNRPGYVPALAAALTPVPALIFSRASPVTHSTPGHLQTTGPTPQGVSLLTQGSPTSSSTPLRQPLLATESHGTVDVATDPQLQVGLLRLRVCHYSDFS